MMQHNSKRQAENLDQPGNAQTKDTPEKEDPVGGTWPNQSQSQSGPQSTGRTGPIDNFKREEAGENAQANEPEQSCGCGVDPSQKGKK